MKGNQAFYKRRCWYKQLFFLFLLAAFFLTSAAQPSIINLYSGNAPGSEGDERLEGTTTNNPMKRQVVYNITKPTLTLFRPQTPNGTAVILIPGGGFYVVNIENEGYAWAQQLVQKGITVLVLKYRTAPIKTADPWQETLSNLRDTALNNRNLAPIRPLATADAFAAVRYVRQNAKELGIDPQKVGVVGFSAGGYLTLKLSTTTEEGARPNFVGMLYALYQPAPNERIPPFVPPAFIAGASDDKLAAPVNSTALYNAWIGAKRPAELHIYTNGGHGLRGSASAMSWITRFLDWLGEIGMSK